MTRWTGRAERHGWGASATCALALVALLLASCSVGHGQGEVWGELSVSDCRPAPSFYQLNPTTFFAQTAEQLLRIRVQRGSDIEVRSDGLAVLVEDASYVKRNLLGEDIPIGAEGPARVEVSLYLNETCPAGRDMTPVVLPAVSGTIRFLALYAPEVDKDEVRIIGEMVNARFEDPRSDERWAELQGQFDFLYVRGSPAQRFP